MEDSVRSETGILGIVIGFGILVIGAVIEGTNGVIATANAFYPPLWWLVGFDLALLGMMLIVASYAWLVSASQGATGLGVRVVGGFLGVVLFVIGVPIQLDESLVLQLVGAQLTILGLSLGMAALWSSVSTASLAARVGVAGKVPAGSGFCPYDGEPVRPSFVFCRKCGRQLAG